MKILVLLTCGLAAVLAQQNYRTTPVPILKQINRHNDDGSYSYGYEAADGSFKIETKHATGEVFGKYGYVDADGKRREIEYGASRRGFEPAGTGINVPPPAISNQVADANSLDYDYDDGQYREDPAMYYNKKAPRRQFANQAAPAPVAPTYYSPPARAPAPVAPAYYNPPPQQPAFRNYNPVPAPDPRIFNGHPATNVNLATGSYSLSYSG